MHSSFFGMPQGRAKDYQEYHELLNLDKPVTIEFDVDQNFTRRSCWSRGHCVTNREPPNDRMCYLLS